MKVTEKKLKNGNIKLDVIASSAEVSNAYATAQSDFAQQMGLPLTFNKTIAQTAQEKMGIRDLDAVVQPQVAQILVPYALDKRNLVPAYTPQPGYSNPPKRGQSFSFTLTVMPKPEYELKSYDPVTITVPPKEFDESSIDEQMERLAESYAKFETAEPHPVGEGDSFKIAIDATANGKPMKNLNTEGRTYIMGAGFMPQGFESQLYGIDVGETKEFSFEMESAKAGADPDVINCKVTVLEMQQKVVPEITDEWVEETLPRYKTASNLRETMAKRLERDFEDNYETMELNAVADELGKRFQGRIDNKAFEAAQQNLLNSLHSQAESQGMTWNQFVRSQGGEEELNMKTTMQTRADLMRGYALDAVYRHENMTLEDEDIDAAARSLSPDNPKMFRNEVENSGQGFALRELAQRYKANRWALDHATVNIQEKKAPAKEAAKPEEEPAAEEAQPAEEAAAVEVAAAVEEPAVEVAAAVEEAAPAEESAVAEEPAADEEAPAEVEEAPAAEE